MNERLRRALFEDFGRVEDDARTSTYAALREANVPAWVANMEAVTMLRDSLQSPEQIDALSAFVGDMVHVALHSALVAVDGGSASASVGRVRVVDESGDSLGEGLHEIYVDYLLDTGRVT